jgi:hypothetical protein
VQRRAERPSTALEAAEAAAGDAGGDEGSGQMQLAGFLDKHKGVTVFLRGGRGKDGTTLYGRPRMHTTRAAALRVPDVRRGDEQAFERQQRF